MRVLWAIRYWLRQSYASYSLKRNLPGLSRDIRIPASERGEEDA